MNHLLRSIALMTFAGLLTATAGCASRDVAQDTRDEPQVAPPPSIQAWMDRLTIEHEYDPETGFIVAREVIVLPAVLREAPPLEQAVDQSREAGRPLIVFATADRCAPCQQYKKDALTDPLIIARLSVSPAIATHVEVDREAASAETFLGSRAIPMTYLLRDGTVVATLRGQRSAADLMEWLNEHQL